MRCIKQLGPNAFENKKGAGARRRYTAAVGLEGRQLQGGNHAIFGRRHTRPLPPSSEQAIALLEGVVIPAFEYLARLKAEGKVLAGGLPVGDRAFVCIIEAASNDGADRIVREMPTWGVLEWKVTPLQSFEARAEMERKAVQALKSAHR